VKTEKKKKQPWNGRFSGYDASDWGYTPSEDFRITLRFIPIVLVLILGFSLGLTSTRSTAGTAVKLIDELGADHKPELEEAYSYIINQDFARAYSIASAVLVEDPENAMAYHIVGLSNARRGLTEEAAVNFQNAVEYNPEFVQAWYDLGIVEESRGEFTSALAAYETALELEPDNPNTSSAVHRIREIVAGEGGWAWNEHEAERLFRDGLAAVNLGDPTSLAYAESIFRALVEDRPFDVSSRNMLGLTLARQGKPIEAEDVLERVVLEEPGYSDAWYNLGMLHRSQGRLEEALNDFETAYSSSALPTFRDITLREIEELRNLLESEVRISPDH